MWDTLLHGTVSLGTAKRTTVCFVCAPNSSMWDTPLCGTVFLGTAKRTTVCFVCAPNSSMWDTPLYHGTVGQGLKVSHLSEFDCSRIMQLERSKVSSCRGAFFLNERESFSTCLSDIVKSGRREPPLDGSPQ